MFLFRPDMLGRVTVLRSLCFICTHRDNCQASEQEVTAAKPFPGTHKAQWPLRCRAWPTSQGSLVPPGFFLVVYNWQQGCLWCRFAGLSLLRDCQQSQSFALDDMPSFLVCFDRYFVLLKPLPCFVTLWWGGCFGTGRCWSFLWRAQRFALKAYTHKGWQR